MELSPRWMSEYSLNTMIISFFFTMYYTISLEEAFQIGNSKGPTKPVSLDCTPKEGDEAYVFIAAPAATRGKRLT